MQDRQSLRIGCVKYLNARPLIHGWPGEVILDHPSTLCAKLARRELDVALVSSLEFLRNPIYRIVDGISISSDGPVYSVVLAHTGAIHEIAEIGVDPAAETSGNLLRYLLNEEKLSPRLTRSIRLNTVPALARYAHLLIGDQAIRFRQQHSGEFSFWDLGEQWKKHTGLPFVYALWLVRPEVVDAKSIADRLRILRDENFGRLDDLIANETQFDPSFCDRYYREHLRFSFGEREKEGLRAFHRLCQKHELMPNGEIQLDVI